MSQAPVTSPTTLLIDRTYSAPRERVFRAWTNADELMLWFAPTDDYKVIATVDLRVGGSYRIEMHHKGGNVHIVVGTYREILAPEKLVFTWKWESESMSPAEETLVTVDFRDLGATTEVRLTHEMFQNETSRDKHAHGWNGCLDRLQRIL